jgi:uncharacterized glyoxalase superfamily protein PhnB
MTTCYRGGCLCGAVRYEAVGTARDLCLCHCESCRRAAGAPNVAWATFETAAFRIVQGELREFRSSPSALRGFCPACGTSLTWRHDTKPAELDVTLASFDDLEALPPEAHIRVEEKPSWVVLRDGLPQFAREREGAANPPRAVRPGYGAVSARIVVDDVPGLVAFIRQVFGAQGEPAAGAPAELRIGDSTILISEAGPRATASAFLYVYVPDVAAAHRGALELGAREIEAPVDTPYGDRRSMLEDRWGNTWQIASYVSEAAR